MGEPGGCFSPFCRGFRFNRLPILETGALLSSWGSQLALKRGNDTNETSFWCPVNAITPEYASVFDFQMLEGKIESLDNPGYVLIAQSQAEKFSEMNGRVGKPVQPIKLSLLWVVVYKDFPQNFSDTK